MASIDEESSGRMTGIVSSMTCTHSGSSSPVVRGAFQSRSVPSQPELISRSETGDQEIDLMDLEWPLSTWQFKRSSTSMILIVISSEHIASRLKSGENLTHREGRELLVNIESKVAGSVDINAWLCRTVSPDSEQEAR